ncbi:MAG: retron St85 family effector protein [Gemmatimonadaceae bacterium]
MLTHTLRQKNGAITKRLEKFGLSIKDDPPLLARANQLIFLCGANSNDGLPSARRAAIKRFIESLSKDYRIIYAESVFKELLRSGHNKNVLDLENEISNVADRVLIVLESPSAFCELGAFSHYSLRNKLIIINDSHFRSEQSFINVGPIAAAEEIKSPVIWYPMASSGIHEIDGIGATFNSLKDIIAKISSGSTRTSRDFSELQMDKLSLYFVHDIVLFTGPVSHRELVNVFIVALGHRNYDILANLLGILRAANLIRSYEAKGTWVYQSSSKEPFMRYHTNIDSLTASFRRFHLRNNNARFVYG